MAITFGADVNNFNTKTDEILRSVGVGYRPLDDPFFQDSYNACKVFQRLGVTVEDEEEYCHEAMKAFPCYAAGCTASFRTLVDFELHYNSKHCYVCIECKKTLPSPRILDIHLQETHDSFFQVLSLKKPVYQCFDSECDLKFNNAQERREHCIAAHRFPKHFRFDENKYPKRAEDSNKMDCEVETSQKLPKPKKFQLDKNQKCRMFTFITKSAPSISKSSDTTSTNSLAYNNGVSALAFIPRQIQKSYSKALTKNQTAERNVLESGTMMDIVDSLPQ